MFFIKKCVANRPNYIIMRYRRKMINDIGRQIDIMMLEALPKMSPKKRLLWRESLAEQGIEMTPTQVDQYISIIELALGI